jgi:hypothetical protein
MKIEPKDVILWSVFDDEPNLVVNKASFGGDRSAAGRYAAEQTVERSCETADSDWWEPFH